VIEEQSEQNCLRAGLPSASPAISAAPKVGTDLRHRHRMDCIRGCVGGQCGVGFCKCFFAKQFHATTSRERPFGAATVAESFPPRAEAGKRG